MDWTCTQLSFGTEAGQFHSHSYYDIPVIDEAGRHVLAHRMDFAGRPVRAGDRVRVGLLDVEAPGAWSEMGETQAWSWQQGPMAQWVAGGPRFVFNDRSKTGFVARLFEAGTGEIRRLPRPLYAVAGSGEFGLSVNMARLDTLRPGYGYAGGSAEEAGLDARRPASDGVWRVPLSGAAPSLLLSLDRAVRFLRTQLPLRERLRHALHRYHYWFNHVKISPDDRRFTVKLRWRRIGGPWNGGMGVSLTCGTGGEDLALLADATSHVLWLDAARLYMWRAGELALFEDCQPRGRRIGALAQGVVTANVHARHLPPQATADPEMIVFDTPYRHEIDLNLYHTGTGAVERLATFPNHHPARGPFRCDLHPCPASSGERIVVTSLADGGRQVYLLARNGAE